MYNQLKPGKRSQKCDQERKLSFSFLSPNLDLIVFFFCLFPRVQQFKGDWPVAADVVLDIYSSLALCYSETLYRCECRGGLPCSNASNAGNAGIPAFLANIRSDYE